MRCKAAKGRVIEKRDEAGVVPLDVVALQRNQEFAVCLFSRVKVKNGFFAIGKRCRDFAKIGSGERANQCVHNFFCVGGGCVKSGGGGTALREKFSLHPVATLAKGDADAASRQFQVRESIGQPAVNSAFRHVETLAKSNLVEGGELCRRRFGVLKCFIHAGTLSRRE